MKPLYQNTQKYYKEFVIGKLMIGFNMCEDPSEPVYSRKWATDKDGIRSEHIIALEKSTEISSGNTLYFLYLGPLMFAFGWA